MDIEVKGLKELIAKLEPSMLDKPLRNFFNRATITIQSRARTKAPVDTGRLRNSIVTQVDSSHPPLWAKVGSNVKYAPFMEYGSGSLSDGPSHGGRHFPPWGDRNPGLEIWAKHHGFSSGFMVARAIGKRGGLKPRRYLRDAFKESLNDVKGYVSQLAAEIQAQWQR